MSDIKTKIFEFAYGGGLLDATAQKAFEGEKAYLRKCNEPQKIVKKYIDDILEGKTVDYYSVAEAVEKSYNEYISEQNKSQKFTFGHSQKLINMTVKNMYTIVYCNEELRKNFEQCHCPMDNIMIDKAIKALDQLQTTEFAVPESVANIVREKGWKGALRKPWSRISSENKKQYEDFQEIIRFLAAKENVSPIEYDYLFW